MNLSTTEIDSCIDLHEYIEVNFHYTSSLIFRGQRDNDWPLETSLDRLLNTLPSNLVSENIVNAHLQRFIKSIRGRRGNNPTTFKSINETWALGQHYGLSTPLLDWSTSPYISLFFAFNSPISPDSQKRVLWALDTKKVQTISNRLAKSGNYDDKDLLEKSRKPIVEIVDPSVEDNPRIICQSGIFTRIPILKSMESWVEKYANDDDGVVLNKIIIDDSERETVLSSLELMNIHSNSLFPDITGAALYCNETLALKVEQYKTMKSVQEIMNLLDNEGFHVK